jgi:polyisoprenoid-binding protein YceI
MFKSKIVSVLVMSLFILTAAFAGDKYVPDQAHTNIGFQVKHMVITTVTGNFTNYDYSFIYDEENPENSSITATIQTGSINTNNEKRDNHLRSADFFDAEKYPEITFESTKIMKTDDGYVARGNLTMRGVTKEIELPFKITGILQDPWGNTKMGVESRLTINRQDYNVSWNNTLDNGGVVVSDNVDIILDLQLQKAA